MNKTGGKTRRSHSRSRTVHGPTGPLVCRTFWRRSEFTQILAIYPGNCAVTRRLLYCPRAVHFRFDFRNSQGCLSAAIPGAEVTLTSTATGAKQTFNTDQNGLYTFVNLNPGGYTVDVDKTGFKRFKRDSIDVQVQQSVRIDAIMEVGADTQTVEVTAETPLLQTDNASLGGH